MKKKRNLLKTLPGATVPALLLLAAMFGMAGCGNDADALPDAGSNDGVRTLNVHIGPKQGFLSADAGAPGTRSTVDESTGTVAWEEGDRVFLAVALKMNDQETSTTKFTMVRTATATWNFYQGFIDTHDKDGTPIDLGTLTLLSGIQVPLDAILVVRATAFHIDCETYTEGSRVTCRPGGGTRSVMQDVLQNLSPDTDLNFDMKHLNSTRLSFPVGLTPGKQYYVDGFNAVNSCSDSQNANITYTSAANVPFAPAPDGSLALCADINGADQTVTLKEVGTDAVVYTATFTAAYGSSYRCIIPTAGGIDPESLPDLLQPAPILPNNKVYAVNGYWVTAPGEENAKYQWSTNADATQMDSDPCAGRQLAYAYDEGLREDGRVE